LGKRFSETRQNTLNKDPPPILSTKTGLRNSKVGLQKLQVGLCKNKNGVSFTQIPVRSGNSKKDTGEQALKPAPPPGNTDVTD
jgi:hypothetical protein